MQLVLHSGKIKEVDTSFIFGNQYNTTDGERVMDKDVKYIIDDIRLGDFYCCSKKQGTYEEVAQAIAEERSLINKCNECWWFHDRTRVEDECSKTKIKEGNKETVIEKRVYEISCAYKPKHEKCVHDIDETPILFREKQFCFFCEYPNGIPDIKPFKQFMVDNAEKYGIVPRWGDGKISVDHSLKHEKLFGSYMFEIGIYHEWFELSNARNSFRFYVDFENKKFILVDSIGYKVRRYLGETRYVDMYKKPIDQPIVNYDKFATWFWQMVDDYKEELK